MSDMLLEERLREFTIGEYHRIAEAGIFGDDERRATIVGQGSFPLGTRNESQPDVAILAARDYARDNRGPEPHEIFAVVELADSSLSVDLGPKLHVFARHGIADYLVVDLDGNRLLHHSRPHELGYGALATLADTDSFSLTALPGVALSAAPFLRTEA
jgi:Uma2 family endonuclease